jgi:hypothetical protein
MVAAMPEMRDKSRGESRSATLRQHFRLAGAGPLHRYPAPSERPVPQMVRFLPGYSGRAAYPGRGGGPWLRMTFPPGLRTWLVPSG